MVFRYYWHDEPETEKTYNTKDGYRDHKNFTKLLNLEPMTPEAWDSFEIQKIEEKKRAGLVLSYIIEK